LSIILSQAIIPDLATLSSHGAVAVDSATVLIKPPESPPVNWNIKRNNQEQSQSALKIHGLPNTITDKTMFIAKILYHENKPSLMSSPPISAS
jgi:hypothetical protein